MSKHKYSKEDSSLETLLDLDGEIFPMEFESASHLLEDFWAAVDEILKT